jgi:hypothetical protein
VVAVHVAIEVAYHVGKWSSAVRGNPEDRLQAMGAPPAAGRSRRQVQCEHARSVGLPVQRLATDARRKLGV